MSTIFTSFQEDRPEELILLLQKIVGASRNPEPGATPQPAMTLNSYEIRLGRLNSVLREEKRRPFRNGTEENLNS